MAFGNAGSDDSTASTRQIVAKLDINMQTNTRARNAGFPQISLVAR
jgi:hypothetical protein